MRFNFYITAENDDEAQACIDFIRQQTQKREAAKSDRPAAEPATSTKSEGRLNVDPGPPSISKIGGSTKDTLIGILRAGMEPSEKHTEHLKLLWARGEVKFDGEGWYL